MNRLSWYTFTPEAEVLPSMREGLREAEYVPGSSSGFRLSRSDQRRVSGQYYERLEFAETLLDPFGGQQEITRVEYRATKFDWLVDEQLLELDNAPRGSGLLARLVQLCRLRCLCASRVVHPLSFATAFLAHRSGSVSSISFRDVSLSSHALASRIEVRGESLFEDPIVTKWIEQKVPVEAASVRVADAKGRPLTFAISKHGVVRFSGALSDADRSLFRRIVKLDYGDPDANEVASGSA